MSTPTSADSFLMGGGGAPSAKFPAIGTTYTGRITEQPEVQQQRDFTTSELKFWKDGAPMMQLVVTIQTSQRDAAISDDDDGKRRLFIKGQMRQAIADAVRTAGGRGLEVGGTLTVTYTHDGPRQGNFSPPKQYTAIYIPAAASELAAPGPDQAPPGVNPVTGEITTPPPAPAAAAVPGVNPNDPAVQALLRQLQGGGQPVPDGPAPF